MRIGTKSVLFGAHQFLLHPLLLALAWWQEYGLSRVRIGTRVSHPCAGVTIHRGVFTWLFDWRLWLAFFVHDLGYFGKPNMDGPEGETHPEFGAAIMRRLCGGVWGDFCLLHSRYYAKALGRPVSVLCYVDKRVICLEPAWLYLPRVWLSGELTEYVANAQRRAQDYARGWKLGDPMLYTAQELWGFADGEPVKWHRALRAYMRRWLDEHRSGKADTWTRVRHSEAAANA